MRFRVRLTFACAASALALVLALPPPASGRLPTGERAYVEAAFAPGDDVVGLIVGRIGAARVSVHMQAYLFTDRRIARALVAARRRGVEVHVIGDAAQHASGGLPHLRSLARAGARVYLDGAHAAMHNKVLILDAGTDSAVVITGSYNFTPSAQSRNAENVVVISGSRALAGRFVADFERQREHSTPWR